MIRYYHTFINAFEDALLQALENLPVEIDYLPGKGYYLWEYYGENTQLPGEARICAFDTHSQDFWDWVEQCGGDLHAMMTSDYGLQLCKEAEQMEQEYVLE